VPRICVSVSPEISLCAAARRHACARVGGPDVEAEVRSRGNGDEDRDRELGDRLVGRLVHLVQHVLRSESQLGVEQRLRSSDRTWRDGAEDEQRQEQPVPQRCRTDHGFPRRADIIAPRPFLPGLSVFVAADAASFCGGPCSPLRPGAVAAPAADGFRSSAAACAASEAALPRPRPTPSPFRAKPLSIERADNLSPVRSPRTSRSLWSAAPKPGVEPHGVAIEPTRVVVASLVFRGETAAVRQERSQRPRRPLLDRIALGHGQRHAELVEQLERDALLEREQLLELIRLLRDAGHARRRDVDDGGVDTEPRRIELENRSLHQSASAQDATRADVRRRVGLPGLLQRDLVEHRLDTRALDDRELRRPCEIGREQLGHPASERAERAVAAGESQWQHGHRLWRAGGSAERVFLLDGALRVFGDLAARQRGQARLKLRAHAARPSRQTDTSSTRASRRRGLPALRPRDRGRARSCRRSGRDATRW
jgi:hypothetical protein